MALKPYLQGLIDITGSLPGSSWSAVQNVSIIVDWCKLEPTQGGAVNWSLIDNKLNALGAGQYALIRVLMGADHRNGVAPADTGAPDWAKALDDSGGSTFTPVKVGVQGKAFGTVGKYWSAGGGFQTAAQSIINRLGARYDSGSANAAKVRGVACGFAGLEYSEPFQRSGTASNGLGSWANLLAAGNTKTLDLAAILQGVKFFVAAFPTTAIEVALNGYSPGGEADIEATCNSMKAYDPNGYGGAQVVFLTTNIQWPRIGGGMTAILGYMNNQATPSQGQTATIGGTNRVGDLYKALQDAAGTIHATGNAPLNFCSAELSGGYKSANSPSLGRTITNADLTTLDSALRANAGAAPATPTVSGVTVGGGTAQGPAGGSTTIAVHGTGLTGTTGVTVGGTAATSVTVVSDRKVTCVTPAHAAGTVDVRVTTPGGTSPANANDKFTYLAGGATTLSPSLPAGLAKNDFMLLFAAWGSTTVTLAPTTAVSSGVAGGWTAIPVKKSSIHSQQLWFAKATGKETGITLTASAATTMAAVLVAEDNVLLTSPFDGGTPTISGQVAGSAGTTIDAGSGLTTTLPNSKLICFLVVTGASGAAPPTITEPQANPDAWDPEGSETGTAKASGTNVAVLLADNLQGAPAAVGDVAGSCDTSAINGAMVVALKYAA